MTKPLLVVESPTKVKTLEKYIGKEFRIAATVGHLKDLPEKEMGIDVDADFKAKYRIIPGKQRVIKKLKETAGNTVDVYLAPDPDREGEAIAWHTAEILKQKGRHFHRVLFHELTQNAIKEALANPTELNRSKYEAQQARRILDRLVGYQISPLLWRKVKGGLSAGRVQSVAVRIICERERAIQAFESEEYWTITALLGADNPPDFPAKLVKRKDAKVTIANEAEANAIVEQLQRQDFVVEKVQKKTTKRNPLPPFTTSKLQQESIRKLRFSAKKTMMVAQQLYEGIELSQSEPVGLITYMRTDSIRISKEAANEALTFIRNQFGKPYSLDKPRFFKNKKKAQDAHEAIRPTSVALTPDEVASYLTADQLALYRLIWQRFVASQMQQALIDNVSIAIAAGDYRLNASGATIKFPGFMKLYLAADDEGLQVLGKQKEPLPELKEGMTLTLKNLDPKQHFTMPPPRFSEASLVKELEENGIGRPSTYAAILSTIREKGYVELSKGYFHPSELGFIVNDLLVDHFPEVFDVEFTAKMEEELDRIESSDMDAANVLSNFWSPFKSKLDTAPDKITNVKGVGIPTGLNCPQCQKPLHIKMGKNGHFLACSGYPDCDYSRDYSRDEKGAIQPIEPDLEEATDKTCPNCEKPMVIKRGKFGQFLACTGFPECKTTQSINPNGSGNPTGVSCPEKDCGGELVERRSKRGKVFYGCSRFPECNFATWDKPVSQPCPVCGAAFLLEKTTKKAGTYLMCRTEECGFKESLATVSGVDGSSSS